MYLLYIYIYIHTYTYIYIYIYEYLSPDHRNQETPPSGYGQSPYKDSGFRRVFNSGRILISRGGIFMSIRSVFIISNREISN